ncbi:MAG: MarC family protein [Nitrosopumilus sp.]|nr:MarC family protein [Nitrosopumilus sp.]MDH3489239.1 MarC family protein [Nitrosopumilus sp.]MDH3516238.1 MarC family protein [Nitrosopumilus sp.]MDH3564003.1 MarC family protein [Nitrosopumilus sp.]MDH5416795.1 MarC family protein [Nitrosopumilus sp.]
MSFENLFFIPENFSIDLIRTIIILFVVIDPIGTIPITIGVTKNMEKSKKRSLFKNTVLVVVILLLVFAFAGNEILSIFEIQISSFMIAGGVLLFIVAIEFLTHGEWRMGGGKIDQEQGIVPLAFPLLSGPGALTIALISFQSSGGLVTFIAILIVTAITYLVLLSSEPINKILGKRGSLIVTRVFAIFLAAFAIQFMINGISEIFQ